MVGAEIETLNRFPGPREFAVDGGIAAVFGGVSGGPGGGVVTDAGGAAVRAAAFASEGDFGAAGRGAAGICGSPAFESADIARSYRRELDIPDRA